MRYPWLRGAAAIAASMIVSAYAAAPAPASGKIWISITNDYESNLDFGPLEKGNRHGKDRAEGTLTRQGSTYVGTVDAVVESTQQVSGLGNNCGPARYEDSQKLKVVGHPVGGFNPSVQTVTYAGVAAGVTPGNAGNEFLLLEFVPETMPTLQPGPRLPQDRLPELVIACHTLIDTLSGIAFLPLNDTRWTMEGGGYIIRPPVVRHPRLHGYASGRGRREDHRPVRGHEVGLDDPGKATALTRAHRAPRGGVLS